MSAKVTRKELIKGAGTAALALSAFSALASHEHDHSEKKSSKKKQNDSGSPKGQYESAMQTSADCLVKGELCMKMCVEELSKGDKMLSDCLKSVRETTALCSAFIQIAGQNSPSTKKLAQLCLETCERCAKECDKHAEHHAECKDCGQACKNCISEFKKILA
ncbi:twin-arginine translocation signal protein [Leptospira perolatii]|uniref:Twin-arginine translocation signal protein n=1 Tax=Leptospira perolatii TaxID=2023191 RepID=A0A2M9ZQL7_9LEPT|nr:four-helix bundle copper-binding protein [Leptospira perolatii]PJZ70551.1 twin-arginine translocation signal protein [Leptospira perolatii]PJZ74387.1 twin-arginine translocation signal protein [Leptospira perolatii]